MTSYVYWIRGLPYAEIAAISAASVRKVDKHAKVRVWSDDPEITRLPWADSFHVLPPGRPAMVANLDAQVAALEYLPDGEQVLFLDADVLMRKPFPWSLVADLYATYRTEVAGDRELAILQPYNYGVLGVRNCSATREAFLWLRQRVLRMSSRNQLWYGNQLALADLLGQPEVEAGEREKRVKLRWTLLDQGSRDISAKLLPCATWNYSPDAEGEDVTDKAVLHFKGAQRKELMEGYLAS